MNKEDTFLCSNKQCLSCKWVEGGEAAPTCGYIFFEDHGSRGCDIPYCKRWEPKNSETRKPKLTDADFDAWNCAFGKKHDEMLKHAFNARRIIMIKDGKIVKRFSSMRTASKRCNIAIQTLQKYCNYHIPMKNGNQLFYENDEEGIRRAVSSSCEPEEL